MFPMVTVPAELAEARRMMLAEIADLQRAGIACAVPRMGIMVEVPAAALTAADFDADFYSIGSNDLIQYATACARDNSSLAALADPREPGGCGTDPAHGRGRPAARRGGEPVRRHGVDARSLSARCSTPACRTLSCAPAQIGPVKLAVSRYASKPGIGGAMADVPAQASDAIAEYKALLRRYIDRRPSGTRQKLAEAFGTHKSFISQITNPAYRVPLPAQHIPALFKVCHLNPEEQRAFLDVYARAHPGQFGAIEELASLRGRRAAHSAAAIRRSRTAAAGRAAHPRFRRAGDRAVAGCRNQGMIEDASRPSLKIADGRITSMKKLMNRVDDVLTESLRGFGAAHADIVSVNFEPTYRDAESCAESPARSR